MGGEEMKKRWISLPAMAVAALVLLALPTSAAAATCSTAPRSWTAGSVDICRGTLVYSDYVNDDYGADTGAVNTTSRSATLAPSAGDQAYPAAGQDATADLVRLTLRVRGHRLFVKGLLNALFQPRQTILAVAIDTDNKPATGGGDWSNLGVSSTRRGTSLRALPAGPLRLPHGPGAHRRRGRPPLVAHIRRGQPRPGAQTPANDHHAASARKNGFRNGAANKARNDEGKSS